MPRRRRNCRKAGWLSLPESDGTIGGVSLTHAEGEILLDQAHAAASAEGGAAALDVHPSEVADVFSSAQSAAVPPAKVFELTFESGVSRLSPAAEAQIEEILAEIDRRRGAEFAVEVLVAGHTDAVGPTGANLRLSRRRADVVARAVRTGLSDRRHLRLRVSASGERELAVPTPVAEERNRRVVVLVR